MRLQGGAEADLRPDHAPGDGGAPLALLPVHGGRLQVRHRRGLMAGPLQPVATPLCWLHAILQHRLCYTSHCRRLIWNVMDMCSVPDCCMDCCCARCVLLMA